VSVPPAAARSSASSTATGSSSPCSSFGPRLGCICTLRPRTYGRRLKARGNGD